VAGLVPDDITGWREPGRDGKPVWQAGLLAKGAMSRDEAELLIMRARVAAGWIEPAALKALEARIAADTLGNELELSDEEKALLALGELDAFDEGDGDDLSPGESVEEDGAGPQPGLDSDGDDEEFDLDALAVIEEGDDDARPGE
jgi:N utilization substance protein A